MKKTGMLLIALALVAALAAVGAGILIKQSRLDVSGLALATISADEGFSEAITVNGARFAPVLSDAKKVRTPPETLEKRADINLEFTAGGAPLAAILYEGGGACYLGVDDRYYSFAPDGLWALLREEAFYRFHTFPVAAVDWAEGNALLPVSENSYQYYELDGAFHTPEGEAPSAPASLFIKDRSVPLPKITPAPTAATLRITSDGNEVFAGSPTEVAEAFLPQAGAVYTVEVTGEYDSPWQRGNVRWEYQLEYDQSPVRFAVQGGGHPGEAVVLRVYNLPEGEAVTFTSDIAFTPTFFDDGTGGKIALLPVNYNLAPGSYAITLSAAGVSEQYTLYVAAKEFQIQHLTVDAATTEETLNSQKANNEFEAAIGPLRHQMDDTQHWSGRFLLPVSDHRVTTQFGAIRYTNGSTVASRHGGVDMANPTGTPVLAPNNGRVLYAGFLQLTGNTALIEHGFGLKTWYYHMDSLNIKTGDMVATGQKIGEVGSTGFSSGPHLHYAMSINNVFINPYTVIETDLLVE